MTDSSFAERVNQAVKGLRDIQYDHRHTQSPVATHILRKLDDTADALESIAEGLSSFPAGAGSSAHQLLADAEKLNVEVTSSLIEMVAATVLSKLIEEEGGGRSSIEFTPADMDAMSQRYVLHASSEGMATKVRIEPRPGSQAALVTSTPASFYRDSGIDASDAKPQAPVHDYNRPVWAIRHYGDDGEPLLACMHDQRDAERHLADYNGPYDLPEPSIENRMCLHPDCPAEHCNQAEVTSD